MQTISGVTTTVSIDDDGEEIRLNGMLNESQSNNNAFVCYCMRVIQLKMKQCIFYVN
jgi:hypothetical protein